jgi:hypothetical protein
MYVIIDAYDANIKVLGFEVDGGYSAMMIGRLVQAPIKILFNSFVLFFTYTAVRPLIKRDR